MNQLSSSSSPPKSPNEKLKSGLSIPGIIPFFWIALAASAGAVLADRLLWSRFFWLIGLALSLLFILLRFLLRHEAPSKQGIPASLCLAAFFLLASRYAFLLPMNNAENLLYYNDDRAVILWGTVCEYPENTENFRQLVLRVEQVQTEQEYQPRPVQGRLLLDAPLSSSYRYGDRLQVQGQLKSPQDGESFSYRQYLAHRGISSQMQFAHILLLGHGNGQPLLNQLYALRDNGVRTLDRLFPYPESALLRGVLLGDDSALSPQLKSAYALTGTAHIIAISGFNMSLLAGLVTRVFTRRIGLYKGGMLSIVVLLLYTLLVGASGSILRAALLACATILGGLIGRRGNALNSLGFCTLGLLLVNPHLLWDIGFQFSILASLGLAIFATPLQSWLTNLFQKRLDEEKSARIAAILGDYFFNSLIAQVMVLPLSMLYFRQFSWLFLLANPLILPVQAFMMILSLCALTAGLLLEPLGQVLAWLAWPAAAFSNRVVLALARLGGPSRELRNFSPIWPSLCYLVIFLLVFRPTRLPRIKNSQYFQIASSVLLSLSALLWLNVFSCPRGEAQLRVFTNSKSPVVFLQIAQGQKILIGADVNATGLLQGLSPLTGSFQRQIDLLLIPRCEESALRGLQGLNDHIKVKQVLWACNPQYRAASRRLFQRFEQSGFEQIQITVNSCIEVGGITRITLYPKNEQLDHLRIEQGKLSILLAWEREVPQRAEGWSLVIAPQAEDYCTQVSLSTTQGPSQASPCVGRSISTEGQDWLDFYSDGQSLRLPANASENKNLD